MPAAVPPLATRVQGFLQEQDGPQAHFGPQVQAGCGDWGGAWQPQVQAAPGQGVQRQAVGVGVSFMADLLGLLADGMSSMDGLSPCR